MPNVCGKGRKTQNIYEKKIMKEITKKKIPEHELGQELTLIDLLDTLKGKGFDTANTTLSFRN